MTVLSEVFLHKQLQYSPFIRLSYIRKNENIPYMSNKRPQLDGLQQKYFLLSDFLPQLLETSFVNFYSHLPFFCSLLQRTSFEVKVKISVRHFHRG